MTMRTLARRAGRRLPLTGLAVLLLTTAGCFQPTGAALEATQIAQAAPPTFTPPPTETLIPSVTPTPADTLPPTITPSPEPPTLTPSPTETPTLAGFPTLTETPTPNLFVTVEPTRFVSLTPVAVAQLPNQQLDPILQTATALAQQAGIGTGLQQIQPTQPPVQQPVITDPLLLTATAVIAGATLTQAAPMTLTMQAIQGPSPTFAIIQPTTGIITQAPGVFPTATPVGPIVSGTDCIHQVQATDRNLFRISLAYGVTVNQIAAASGIANPALIFVGQQLTIPGCGTTGFRPPPTSQPTAAFPSDPNTTNPGTNVCGPVYVVQQGDTLFEISLRCGVPVMTIANLNGITNINLIFINQDLRLQ